MISRFKNLFDQKILRYAFSGSIVFIFNLTLAYFIFNQPWAVQSHLSMNMANTLVTELAILFSFPIHNFFTWRQSFDSFFPKIIKFHLVTLGTLVFRILIFAVLDFMGFHWFISTFFSIAIIFVLNFLGFDLFIFKSKEVYSGRDGISIYKDNGIGTKTLELLEDAHRYNHWLASMILPYLGRENLELGAGIGTLTNIISQAHNVTACEISDFGSGELKERFKNNPKVKAIIRDFFEYERLSSLDCIYSANVLEHIENDFNFIGRAAELLRPGGYFVALLPAGMWLYSKLDRELGHFRRYNAKDKIRIYKLIEKKGLPLKMLKYKYFNPIGAFGWFVKAKILSRTKITRMDMLIMNSLLPFIGWCDLLPLPFGQSVLMVIKKNSHGKS